MTWVDFELTGEDAAEVASLLKIPKLQKGIWGWRRVLEQAARLRELRVRQLISEVGYDCQIAIGHRDE